ncbi:MAG: hypothetical protein AB1767_09080 [Bacillota bacterium]
MVAPSYRQRLEQLNSILAAGVSLFARMREAEKQLQGQLINGDHQAVAQSEELRRALQQEAVSLEEKRRALVPPEISLHRYITTRVGRSRQGELLAGLKAVQDELRQLRALHAVNRSLLEERLRFIRELQELCLNEQGIYDRRGQLKSGPDQVLKNLDCNC